MKAEGMEPPIMLLCDILYSPCSESRVLTGWNSTGRFFLGFELHGNKQNIHDESYLNRTLFSKWKWQNGTAMLHTSDSTSVF